MKSLKPIIKPLNSTADIVSRTDLITVTSLSTIYNKIEIIYDLESVLYRELIENLKSFTQKEIKEN